MSIPLFKIIRIVSIVDLKSKYIKMFQSEIQINSVLIGFCILFKINKIYKKKIEYKILKRENKQKVFRDERFV